MRSHRFDLCPVVGYLQIGLFATIALASALAVAAHPQSQKCAAPFLPVVRSHSTVALDEAEAHFLRAARGVFRWSYQETYAFRVCFAPSAAVGSVPCVRWQQCLWPLPVASAPCEYSDYPLCVLRVPAV